MLMIFEKIEQTLEMIKKPVYMGSLFILHFVYILITIGVIQYTPQIISNLNIFIQIFISVFLMIKFFPFRKHELKEFDSTIIFGSAIFLLTNLGFTEYLTNYFGTKKVVSEIERVIHNNVKIN
jgi:hypothetical protein